MDLIRTTYPYEHLLIGVTMPVSVAGIWTVYVDAAAAPEPHHHLHAATVFAWLFLLLCQLRLVDRGRHAEHRRVGLLVLLVAPVLFAASALLSVHSAHSGLTSGHTLIGFVPQFRIEGPETFHRCESAAKAAQTISAAVAVALFLKDVRNGWPFLLAGSFFFLDETIRAALSADGGIDALTRFVGSLDRTAAFAVGYVVPSLLLAGTGLLGRRVTRPGLGGGSPRA